MENHIYKTIEVIGTSSNSIEEAVNRALSKAHHSLDNLRWFTIKEIRGAIKGGAVAEWQVTTNISFTLND